MDKKFAQVNLAALVLWGGGLLIENIFGLSYLRWIAAAFSIFFLPGWNASLLLFPRLFTRLERTLFSLLISFPALALVLYAVHIVFQTPFGTNLVNFGTAALLFASFVAGAIGTRRHHKGHNEKEALWPLLAAVSLYIALVAAVFAIYPFIPEADPYVFLSFSQEVLETGHFPISSFRPLFITLTTALAILADMPLEVIFKVMVPLLGTMMLPPIFLSARRHIKRNAALFLISALPLVTPVIVLEGVTPRPQVTILFALPGILYFLILALQKRAAGLAVAMFFLTLALFQFHEFALILSIPSVITLLVLLWPTIKRWPALSAAVTVLSMLVLYPLLDSLGVIRLLQLRGVEALEHVTLVPRPWFLGHYTNIEGVEVGWPGWTAIYYYAYNIGPALPLLVGALVLARKKISRRPWRRLWPALVTAGIFFVFAEILPRFSVSYFPERMWPFLILASTLTVPAFVQPVERRANRPLIKIVTGLAFLIGIGGALYIAHAKQGLVTRKEYEAAQFLRQSTPESSAVISQGGNGPLISFYADRLFVHVDIFSPHVTAEMVKQTLNRVPEFLDDEERTRPSRLGPDQPLAIYVLYSRDKFNHLYGMRAWWRNLNYANADLKKFDDKTRFEKTYDDGHVFIWRVIDL